MAPGAARLSEHQLFGSVSLQPSYRQCAAAYEGDEVDENQRVRINSARQFVVNRS